MSENIEHKREPNALLLHQLDNSLFVQSLAEIQSVLNKDTFSFSGKGILTEQSLATTVRSIVEFYEVRPGP